MTTELTRDQAATEAKAWLEENYDPDISVAEWLARLADSGWAAPTWAPDSFGKGLSNAQAAEAYKVFREAMVPGPPGGLSFMLAAPTIVAHGSEEQKQRYVRGILTGEEVWCQLFSEPGAGSDLAGVQTRAMKDGDEWIVNGQKVWTSGGQGADLGMLIARTNPDAPKHKGITYFALEMDQPGVDVRPLKQITGQAHFCEVFFTDARVHNDAIIGGLNEGWGAALTTLANERVGLGGGGAGSFGTSAPGGRRAAKAREQSLGEFIENARKNPSVFAMGGMGGGGRGRRGGDMMIDLAKGQGKHKEPIIRQHLVQLYTLNKLSGWNALRARAAVAAGSRPGPEASIGKLMISRITRASRDLGMEILGANGMLSGQDAPLNGMITMQFLGSPAPSIYGGTDEVQKNIIGERVLGLPKEPDISRDVPFKELKVGTQR
jgi:alkylation response protein AidB-like acyl-CoA dehydrogenase